MSKEGQRVSDVYEEVFASMVPFFLFLINPLHYLLDDKDKIPSAKVVEARWKKASKKLESVRKRYNPEMYKKMAELTKKEKGGKQ